MGIKDEVMTLPVKASEIIVANDEQYQSACDFLTMTIKPMRKKIDETFDPIIKKAHQAHKEAVAQKKSVEAPLMQAEKIVKPKIADYLNEKERQRVEKERKLQEEARKRAEAEALERAAMLEKEGAKEEAEAIISEPIEAPTVIVQSSAPKAEGISVKKLWKFEIVDESKIPREYLMVNEKAIGAVVRSLKDKAHIAGVKIYSVDSVAAGVK